MEARALEAPTKCRLESRTWWARPSAPATVPRHRPPISWVPPPRQFYAGGPNTKEFYKSKHVLYPLVPLFLVSTDKNKDFSIRNTEKQAIN